MAEDREWGWGLKLTSEEAKKVLEELLLECATDDEFRQRCAFVFKGPMILTKWGNPQREAFIVCDGQKNGISAVIDLAKIKGGETPLIAVLRKDEMLIDLSQGQFERGGVLVPVKKGQYRLEKIQVRWGDNNSEMPWLVLEKTTIGAREAWWLTRVAKGEISLKLDANI